MISPKSLCDYLPQHSHNDFFDDENQLESLSGRQTEKKLEKITEFVI